MPQDKTDKTDGSDHTKESQISGLRAYTTIFKFTHIQHLFILIPAILLATISGVITPLITIVTGSYLNTFSEFASNAIEGDDLGHATLHLIYVLLIVAAATWLIKGAFFSMWTIYGELQAKTGREELFSTLLVRDLGWFEAQEVEIGTLLSRLQSQIRDFQMSVSQTLGFIILSAAQSIASTVVAFFYCWRLTLSIFASFPIIGLVLWYISSGLQDAIDNQQSCLTDATKLITHAINNIVVVKCHNAQSAEAIRYAQILQSANSSYKRQVRIEASQSAFMRLTTVGVMLVAGSYAAILTHQQNATPGQILTTFWACVSASQSLSKITSEIVVLEKGRNAITAVHNSLTKVRKRGKQSVPRHGLTPLTLEGDIELENVTFAYPTRPDCQILQNSTLFFPARETTFIIGKSGSGKSTVGNILLRYYDILSGRVTIDGIDIKFLDVGWLRNNVTLVQQDSILFNETIFTNVALGSRNFAQVTPTQVLECLEFAQLHEFVDRLPDGINTKIGANGTSLSGGQKQRIALARARLRNTAIIIMDECTSALDRSSRVLVMDRIRKWRRNKTTIIITHDLSQINAHDFVYVLKEGKIIAEGYGAPICKEFERRSDLGVFEGPTVSSNNVQETSLRLGPEDNDHQRNTTPIFSHSNSSDSTVASRDSDNTNHSAVRLIADQRTRLMRESLLRRLQSRLSNLFASPRSQKGYPTVKIGSDCNKDLERLPYQISGSHHNERATFRTIQRMSMHPILGVQHNIDVSDDRSFGAAETSTEVSLDTFKDNIKSLEGLDMPSPSSFETVTIGGILTTIWPSLSNKEKYLFLVAIACAIASAAIPALISWILVRLLQNLSNTDNWQQVAIRWSMALLGVGVTDGCLCYSLHFLFEITAQAWINSLRRKSFTRIIDQPKSWFDCNQTLVSEIRSTLDNLAEQSRNILSHFLEYAMMGSIMIIISVTWSFVTCWKLTLVGLSCTSIVLIISKFASLISTGWEKRSGDAVQEIANVFAESFSDVRTVRALTLESYFHKKYMTSTYQAFMIGIRKAMVVGLFFGASDATSSLVAACVFGYASVLAKQGQWSAQAILTVLSLLLFTMANVSFMVAYLPRVASCVDAGNRLLRFTNLPHSYHDQSNTTESRGQNFKGDIKLNNVTFCYPSRPEAIVLDNISLHISSGSCTAIVGASGSGKSSIIALILGLYPLPKTNLDVPPLEISGIDATRYKKSELCSYIAYVPQSPVLLPMSVRDNILYGLDTTLSAIQETMTLAARAACIGDFIQTLPDGYDTIIGHGGLSLSGGQTQRIAIARAFARRPHILILDEPTSALDPESARIIRESIRALLTGGNCSWIQSVTVIIVTHSKEMMDLADKIVVLDSGLVVEEGDFDLLMRRRGRLWQMLSASSHV